MCEGCLAQFLLALEHKMSKSHVSNFALLVVVNFLGRAGSSCASAGLECSNRTEYYTIFE